jgi:hypothetical protein
MRPPQYGYWDHNTLAQSRQARKGDAAQFISFRFIPAPPCRHDGRIYSKKVG